MVEFKELRGVGKEKKNKEIHIVLNVVWLRNPTFTHQQLVETNFTPCKEDLAKCTVKTAIFGQ